MIKPKSKGPGGKPSKKKGKKSGKRRDNAVTYNLKKGSNVVYKGITNNPERRENEHKKEGKNFTKLEPTSHKMLRENAKNICNLCIRDTIIRVLFYNFKRCCFK